MLSYESSPIPIKGHNKAPASVPLPPSLQATPTTPSPLTNAPLNSAASGQHVDDHHHIWLVTGPAGCGKSTIAEYLANTLDMPYIEGDAFHPAANVEKMRTGTPLTDADRWDWLTALREESIHQINRGANGVVLTCSALKRKYRDVIRVAGYFDHRLLIHFIFLDAPEEVLLARVSQRQGHYMGANMVHSQFEVLERPTRDERDVVTIDVSRTVDEVKRDALANALETMTETNDDKL
ncbi:P-loop containing nucleoside triphosphate hydrolase protein [Thelonectria olida]|uniref:Gluconokinase n=1 Tax=Thelonectria olida TaxID=1576542 RepID=A0A9P9AVZ6_9HYPO|nr:P-loop containing nucleoside triphosphate hydrolase protein [Thelonectria olida]